MTPMATPSPSNFNDPNNNFLVSGSPSASTSGWPYSNVPSLLKDISNWVGWKSIVREGKPEKLPFDVKTSRMAKADDSSTWASFDQVLAATDILNGSDYDGPGFELGGTNIAGIDFDNAIG